MNPVKVLGGLLIALGVILRAISVFVLAHRARTLPNTDSARKKLARSRRNAFAIDAAFILCGVYCILRA